MEEYLDYKLCSTSDFYNLDEAKINIPKYYQIFMLYYLLS